MDTRMSRYNPFPGITVEEVSVEAGGESITRTFDTGLSEDVAPEVIQDVIDNIPEYGPQFTDSRLEYLLTINATSKVAAMQKARAYIRVKNPFEPDIIDVHSIETINGGMLMKTYSVSANIRK